MAQYVCTSLSNPNLVGQRTCQTWAELPPNPPILPDLTIDQVNELAVAIITVLVIAWCFKTLAQFINS